MAQQPQQPEGIMPEVKFSASALTPRKLDLTADRGESFTLWQHRWEDFVQLTDLQNKDPVFQMAVFRSCVMDETLKVVMNLHIPEADRNKPEEIIKALRIHARGQVSVVMERREFNLRSQQPGEAFDDYLTSLRELAKTCDFCEQCIDSLIRDRIVTGIRDGDVVEKLLAIPKLTLENAVDICRAEEAAKRFRCEIKGEPQVAYANSMSQYKQGQRGYRGRATSTRNRGRGAQPTNLTCYYCAKPHGPMDTCPAKDSACSACGKRGHWAAKCRSQGNRSRGWPNQTTGRKKGTTLGCVLASIGDKTTPKVEVIIGGDIANGASVQAIPDTGADCTACGEDILGLIGVHPDNLRAPSLSLKAADGHQYCQVGEFDAKITCGDRSVRDTIHVIKGTTGLLMSWYATRDLGFLPSAYPVQLGSEAPEVQAATVQYDHRSNVTASGNHRQVTAEDIIREFPSVFDSELKAMPGEEFRIELEDDVTPFCVRAPRAIPYAYRDKVQVELERMVREDIIAPVTEPTVWCAPIVVAPKKGSDEIRICVDLTKLNKYVKRERYQSPTPREAVADIAASQAKYFTTLDALSGYHQCPLAPECQNLTTFITPFGRFKFLRAPFGICSISEHYNRRMDEALTGIPQVRKIVDDCLVYDADFDAHVNHVRQVLQRCAAKGISLKRDKFVFAQQQVGFCGYIITPDGYHVNPDITKAIRDFPKPTNVTDLRSFFGLANQLANFTSDIAAKLEPLRPLLKKNREFCWDEVQDEAFLAAREALATSPVLAYYDPRKETALEVDASRLHGLGFVLQQRQTDGEWRMVQAGSRFLSETETRYAMIELELLGIAWAVRKCRMFLDGLPHFEIITDHRHHYYNP